MTQCGQVGTSSFIDQSEEKMEEETPPQVMIPLQQLLWEGCQPTEDKQGKDESQEGGLHGDETNPY